MNAACRSAGCSQRDQVKYVPPSLDGEIVVCGQCHQVCDRVDADPDPVTWDTDRGPITYVPPGDPAALQAEYMSRVAPGG